MQRGIPATGSSATRRIGMQRNDRSSWRNVVVIKCLAAAACLAGCATKYQVPGKAADFRALGIGPEVVEEQTEQSIAKRLDRKPLARFPTSIAVVRVQGPGYSSYTSRGYGQGRFTVVTNRDVEPEDSFARLTSMPMVTTVLPLNRLVMPEHVSDEEDLRGAAASAQADMLLIYTFDTEFGTENKVAPLGLITLGLFPDREARVTSTASAALLDTRNGYIYGLTEATGKDDRITNAWTNEAAVDASRRKAEQEAFEGLVASIATMWDGVVRNYGPPQNATQAVLSAPLTHAPDSPPSTATAGRNFH
jgi:hypothetical protein